MEERSLRQCKGDWRPNGEREGERRREYESERERQEGMHERAGRNWLEKESDGGERRARERARRKEGHGRGTVFVIKGATGRGVEESQPTERLISPARRGVTDARRIGRRFSACLCHVILQRSHLREVHTQRGRRNTRASSAECKIAGRFSRNIRPFRRTRFYQPRARRE